MQGEDANGDAEEIEIPGGWGYVSVASILGDVTVTYAEYVSYDDYDPDSLKTSSPDNGHWTIEGVNLVDKDGDDADIENWEDEIPEAFSTIDYSALEARLAKVTYIDTDEDTDVETITLQIDNAPDLRFAGEQVAVTSSTDNRAAGTNFSGQTGRWTELALYKTQKGRYVCHQIGRTRWQGERDRFSGKVCDSVEEVIEFFGHRWLAKDLYAEAGIEDVREVDG